MRQSAFLIMLYAAALAPLADRCRAEGGFESYADYVVIRDGADVVGAVDPLAHSVSLDGAKGPSYVEATEKSNLARDSKIYLLSINIDKDAQPTPEQLSQAWEEGRAKLEAALQNVQASGREIQHKQIERQSELLEHQLQEIRLEYVKVLDELSARQAEAVSSETNIGKGFGEAASRQRELQLQNAGIQARREAIERRVDEVRGQAADAVDNDEIIKELRAILEIREKQLKAVRAVHETGTTTEAELRKVEAEVAQARIDLLKSKRDAELRAGGAALQELNNELSRLVIQSAETEAQLKANQEMMGALRDRIQKDVRGHAEIGALQEKLAALRSRQNEIESRLFSIERQSAELPQGQVTLRPLKQKKADVEAKSS
jgi:hypothetical protein